MAESGDGLSALESGQGSRPPQSVPLRKQLVSRLCVLEHLVITALTLACFCRSAAFLMPSIISVSSRSPTTCHMYFDAGTPFGLATSPLGSWHKAWHFQDSTTSRESCEGPEIGARKHLRCQRSSTQSVVLLLPGLDLLFFPDRKLPGKQQHDKRLLGLMAGGDPLVGAVRSQLVGLMQARERPSLDTILHILGFGEKKDQS